MAAVTRVHTVKRYIGTSFDVKPRVGDVGSDGSTLITTNDLPTGSELYLTDLGLTERWNGSNWIRDPTNFDQKELHDALRRIQIELVLLRMGLQDAGMCNEVNDLDAHNIIFAQGN